MRAAVPAILALLSLACSSGQDGTSDLRFAASSIQGLARGYVDSPFISKDGSRIYFLYSPYPPRVFMGAVAPGACTLGAELAGHVSAPGVEWNTDLYYLEWNGSSWGSPVNLGSNVNTLGNECCVWLNDSETEIIFYRGTDLDSNGSEGDLGLTQSGNFRATRASRNDPWGPAAPLDGDYGINNQSNTVYRHDIHKAPSGNYYLWENANGVKRLQFGRFNGTSYDSPVYIAGTAHEDTQVWVSDDEKLLLYNHRVSATTDLYKMTRASASDAWSAPVLVPTSGFEDSVGNRIWGEPTFDSTLGFMLYVQFNTTDATCWSADIMYSAGSAETGFTTPRKLTQ